ncbi:hypothetical protein ACOSQ4_016906 [Xanthoceras sorbifolium]
MCYFASLTTEGYQRAKLAIDSLCTKMQLLIQEWKDMSHDRMSDHIKDPPAVTAKGLVRRTNKTGAKLCNCGRYRQPGHIAKTCQANIQKGASVIGSNEGGQTSGTTPTIGVPPNTFEFPYNESSATNYAHMTNDDVHYRNDGQGHMYEQYNPWWFPPNRL